MEKPIFVSQEIYHVYNRGVEKRTTFQAKGDYYRFIHDIWEFNDINPAPRREIEIEIPVKKEPLVSVLAFCLMPNHYHLLVRQIVKNGIVNFMKKLGTGYVMYFNKKYERVGPLFQGRFKAVHVGSDQYFRYLTHYIHLNPLDLYMPEWRDGKINNKEALEYLKDYRWSSLEDYLGNPRFKSIISNEVISEFYYKNEYQDDFYDYLKNTDLSAISDLVLE